MLNWVSCNALKVKALRALFLFISIVMHICEALDINPYSEEAAHFSGDLS